jgi:hypothetical protein
MITSVDLNATTESTINIFLLEYRGTKGEERSSQICLHDHVRRRSHGKEFPRRNSFSS